MIDRFGYHITGFKKDANAFRLHDNVVHILVILLRLLGLSVALEPMNIFQNHEPDDNRRPDILIRNPYGGNKQIITDVAVTGIDGTTRTNDDKPKQPLVTRRKQKKEKYGPIAELNGLAFFSAIFSYNGEMDVVIKNFLLQQIKYKLQLVDGEVKKIKSPSNNETLRPPYFRSNQ